MPMTDASAESRGAGGGLKIAGVVGGRHGRASLLTHARPPRFFPPPFFSKKFPGPLLGPPFPGGAPRHRRPPRGATRPREPVDGGDESFLRGARCAAQPASARRRQPDLRAPRVAGRGPALDQPLAHEPRDHRRYRALMRPRALGELVQREAGRLGDGAQHEQLRAAQAHARLGQARRLAQRLDDAPDRVEHVARVRAGRAGGARARYIGSHTSSVSDPAPDRQGQRRARCFWEIALMTSRLLPANGASANAIASDNTARTAGVSRIAAPASRRM